MVKLWALCLLVLLSGVRVVSACEVALVVGGDRLAVVSAEYQYYVTPEWRLTTFVDAGNAFNSRDFDAVVGAGFGVHYVSPVGAIRIDFGNPVSEESSSWRVHLNVGAEF